MSQTTILRLSKTMVVVPMTPTHAVVCLDGVNCTTRLNELEPDDDVVFEGTYRECLQFTRNANQELNRSEIVQ